MLQTLHVRIVNWVDLVAHVLVIDGSALFIVDPLTRSGGLLVIPRTPPPVGGAT